MKKALNLLALFALGLASAAHAQAVRHQDPASKEAAIEAKQQYVGAASVDKTTNCTYAFTSGSGNTYLKHCVTKKRKHCGVRELFRYRISVKATHSAIAILPRSITTTPVTETAAIGKLRLG